MALLTTEPTSEQISIAISKTSTIPMTTLTTVSTANKNKQRNSRETRSLIYNTNTRRVLRLDYSNLD